MNAKSISYTGCFITVCLAFLALPALAATAVQSIHTPQSIGMGSAYWAVPANKAAGDPAVIYLSVDMGETWDESLPLPTNRAEPPAITHLASSWDYVYVATEGEGIFRTDDGRNWEKWNDADVSFRYMAAGQGGTIAAITEDGATFTAAGNGFNNTFTQWHDIPLTATAISLDIPTIIGTSDGKLYTFLTDGLFDMTDGQGSRPGPLPGAVREIVQTQDYRFYLVEFGDGTRGAYSKPSFSMPGPFKRMSIDGASIAVDFITEAAGGIGIVTAETTQRLLYSCDNGDSWTEIPLPVTSGVNSFTMGGCNSSVSHWGVRIATDEGAFLSRDQGATWTAYGDIGGGQTGSVRIARSDLAIQMMSPGPNSSVIANTTSRFELRVANQGAERVEDIFILLDFTVWYDGSTQGSSSRGTSIKVDGVECEAVYDSLGIKLGDCGIAALDPGEAAQIVWIHGLGSTAFSMQLEAEVDSTKLNDSNSNNNKVYFSPNVRGASDVAVDSGGGGGAFGPWLLVLMLFRFVRLTDSCCRASAARVRFQSYASTFARLLCRCSSAWSFSWCCRSLFSAARTLSPMTRRHWSVGDSSMGSSVIRSPIVSS